MGRRPDKWRLDLSPAGFGGAYRCTIAQTEEQPPATAGGSHASSPFLDLTEFVDQAKFQALDDYLVQKGICGGLVASQGGEEGDSDGLSAWGIGKLGDYGDCVELCDRDTSTWCSDTYVAFSGADDAKQCRGHRTDPCSWRPNANAMILPKVTIWCWTISSCRCCRVPQPLDPLGPLGSSSTLLQLDRAPTVMLCPDAGPGAGHWAGGGHTCTHCRPCACPRRLTDAARPFQGAGVCPCAALFLASRQDRGHCIRLQRRGGRARRPRIR